MRGQPEDRTGAADHLIRQAWMLDWVSRGSGLGAVFARHTVALGCWDVNRDKTGQEGKMADCRVCVLLAGSDAKAQESPNESGYFVWGGPPCPLSLDDRSMAEAGSCLAARGSPTVQYVPGSTAPTTNTSATAWNHGTLSAESFHGNGKP